MAQVKPVRPETARTGPQSAGRTPRLGKGIHKRLGPLPLWGWAVVGGGGLGMLLLLRKKKGATGTSGFPSLGVTPGGGFGGGGGGGAPPGGGILPGLPGLPTLPGGGGAAPSPVTTPTDTGTGSGVVPGSSGDVANVGPGSIHGGTYQAAINSISSTWQLAQQELRRSTGTTIAIQTGYNSLNQQLATQLNQQGTSAVVSGGQVYAQQGGTSLNFFQSLPPEAQQRMANLFRALGLH